MRPTAGVDRTTFGLAPDGSAVYRVELLQPAARVRILTWGATVRSMVAPDRYGHMRDAILGF